MKKILLAALIMLSFAAFALADEYVHGYTRKDGTYVEPYHRSSPDRDVTNNYNFKGNTNPYTGREGTDSYKSNPSSPYYDGSTKRSR
jgi:hypothetical protein